MQINKIDGTSKKVKCVHAKGNEKEDSKKTNVYVIDRKDLKWIIARFEKIDSTLETMKQQRN